SLLAMRPAHAPLFQRLPSDKLQRNKPTIPTKYRNKISKTFDKAELISIFSDCLRSSPHPVRVEGMKTSHTLIQLRQHRSLCLVSARLPG
ncbi:hypothetical protein, partial [Pseudomonas corrugata]|uniref:hypothetical protein n=1 Tax=Pseudomonas corrugata TaxID=47879 RepID=UPI0019D6D1D0